MEYLFKPFECRYEHYWQTQCYNRMWYLGCILVNPITLVPVTMLKLETLFLCMVIVFIFQMIQLPISCKIWEDHCDILRKQLIKGVSR